MEKRSYNLCTVSAVINFLEPGDVIRVLNWNKSSVVVCLLEDGIVLDDGTVLLSHRLIRYHQEHQETAFLDIEGLVENEDFQPWGDGSFSDLSPGDVIWMFEEEVEVDGRPCLKSRLVILGIKDSHNQCFISISGEMIPFTHEDCMPANWGYNPGEIPWTDEGLRFANQLYE